MTKAKTTQAAFMKTVEKVRTLLKEESNCINLAEDQRLQAAYVAFDIGEVIELEVLGEYGKSKMPQFAKLCGFKSDKTAYNYRNLFRAAGTKLVLCEHNDLPRIYWYAIGSSIKWTDDVMGDMLRRNLLQFPLWRTTDSKHDADPDNPHKENVVDIEMMQHVCGYLRDLRNELKSDGILYAFEEYELYIGKPPSPGKAFVKFMADPDRDLFFSNIPPHSDYREAITLIMETMPHDKRPIDIFYLISFNKGDEEKYEQALRAIAIKWDAISQSTGWPGRISMNLGKNTKKILEEHRLRPETYKKGSKAVQRALTKKKELAKIRAQGGIIESVTLQEKVIHGKCEELLNTNLFGKDMIDACITDPPYGKYDEWRKSVKVEYDRLPSPEEAAKLVASVADILVKRQLIKEKFIWFSFCTTDFVHICLPPLLRVFKKFKPKYQVLIWDKVNAGKAGGFQTFARQATAILYINVGKRILETVTLNDKRTEMHSSLFSGYPAKPKTGEGEPWKPVELMSHLIRLATGEDDEEEANRQLILDPFCGAGSTGVACVRCNRDFRLIDSNEGQRESALDNVTLETNS